MAEILTAWQLNANYVCVEVMHTTLTLFFCFSRKICKGNWIAYTRV